MNIKARISNSFDKKFLEYSARMLENVWTSPAYVKLLNKELARIFSRVRIVDYIDLIGIKYEATSQYEELLKKHLLERGVDPKVFDNAKFDAYMDLGLNGFESETFDQIAHPN